MIARTVSPARVVRSTGVLATVAVAVSSASGIGAWPSIAVGAGFMLANFHLIRLLVSRLMTARGSPAVAAGLLILKVMLVLALLGGLFYQVPIAPLSFAFGAGLLLVAILLDATWFGDPVEDHVETNETES